MSITKDLSFSTTFFYGVVEVTAFIFTLFVVTWFVQSKEDIVVFSENPGYRIIEITEKYIDVKWMGARTLTKCSGTVYPTIVGVTATHVIPHYNFIVTNEEKTFTRRYEIPEYFQYGDYELILTLVARCNPLFENVQVIKVAFRYLPEGAYGQK
jgi:hypothetical protein